MFTAKQNTSNINTNSQVEQNKKAIVLTAQNEDSPAYEVQSENENDLFSPKGTRFF